MKTQAGGLIAVSRWLSRATPPDQEDRKIKRTPAGCKARGILNDRTKRLAPPPLRDAWSIYSFPFPDNPLGWWKSKSTPGGVQDARPNLNDAPNGWRWRPSGRVLDLFVRCRWCRFAQTTG